MHTPAAAEPAPGSTRLRPLIYVYELPPMYNQVLLQYRLDKKMCTHRLFDPENGTVLNDENLYNTEPGLHEMMLQSEHRTLDPEVGSSAWRGCIARGASVLYRAPPAVREERCAGNQEHPRVRSLADVTDIPSFLLPIPQEADFFYLPIYTSCMIFPILSEPRPCSIHLLSTAASAPAPMAVSDSSPSLALQTRATGPGSTAAPWRTAPTPPPT